MKKANNTLKRKRYLRLLRVKKIDKLRKMMFEKGQLIAFITKYSLIVYPHLIKYERILFYSAIGLKLRK